MSGGTVVDVQILKQAREALGLSHLEIYAGTGVSPSLLRRAEKGNAELSAPQNILVQEFLARRATLLTNLQREGPEDSHLAKLSTAS